MYYLYDKSPTYRGEVECDEGQDPALRGWRMTRCAAREKNYREFRKWILSNLKDSGLRPGVTFGAGVHVGPVRNPEQRNCGRYKADSHFGVHVGRRRDHTYARDVHFLGGVLRQKRKNHSSGGSPLVLADEGDFGSDTDGGDHEQ